MRFGDIYGACFRAGFGPDQVDRWSLWQLSAIGDFCARMDVESGAAPQPAPTPDEFDAAVARFSDG